MTKLGTYIDLKRIWNPNDFQGQRSRSQGLIFRRGDTPRFALPLFKWKWRQSLVTIYFWNQEIKKYKMVLFTDRFQEIRRERKIQTRFCICTMCIYIIFVYYSFCIYTMCIYIIFVYYSFCIYTMCIQYSLVKPPPSVQSVVWRYNEFGDKLRDIENRKLCDHMKR